MTETAIADAIKRATARVRRYSHLSTRIDARALTLAEQHARQQRILDLCEEIELFADAAIAIGATFQEFQVLGRKLEHYHIFILDADLYNISRAFAATEAEPLAGLDEMGR